MPGRSATEPVESDRDLSPELLERGVHRLNAGLLGHERPIAVAVSSDNEIIGTRIIRDGDTAEQVLDELSYMLASADPVPQ